MNPTNELYASLLTAYDHFNEALFKNTLPKVIFTVQRKKGVMGYFAPERWGDIDGQKCSEIAINPAYIANSRLIEVMQTLVHEMVHCWQHCFGTPGRDYYHNKEWALKMIEVGLMPSSTGEPGGRITGQSMGDYIIEGGKFIEAFHRLEAEKAFQLKWIDRRSIPRLFDPVIAPPGANVKQGQDQGASLSHSISQNLPADLMTTVSHSANSTAPFSDFLPSNFLIPEAAKRQTRYRYMCSGCGTKVYGKTHLNIRCDDCDQIFECDH